MSRCRCRCSRSAGSWSSGKPAPRVLCGRPFGCKRQIEKSDGWVDCSHVSGLLARQSWPLPQMEAAWRFDRLKFRQTEVADGRQRLGGGALPRIVASSMLSGLARCAASSLTSIFLIRVSRCAISSPSSAIAAACWAADLTGTGWMFGRPAASEIASASFPGLDPRDQPGGRLVPAGLPRICPKSAQRHRQTRPVSRSPSISSTS